MNPQSIKEQPERDPLVFHLRSSRFWYGEGGLTQDELAAVAAVSPPLIYKYERARELPQSVEALLRIALALQVSIEQLIDPKVIARLRAGVEGRRTALEMQRKPKPPIGFRVSEQ